MRSMSNSRPTSRPRGPQAIPLTSEQVSPGFAALLSGLLPGLGQAYGHRWIRGILMLITPVLVLTLGTAFIVWADPLAAFAFRNAPLVAFVVIGGAFAFHLFVVGDAFAGRMHRLRGRHALDYAALALVTVALVAGYGTIYRESAPWAALAARVFAPLSRAPATTPGDRREPPPAWTGEERLNVLLLGIDSRDGDPVDRNTDTMIVLSLDPSNGTGAMLSIPRDIYVDRPGLFQGKINAAFAAGGPQLARRVVDDLLGIRINSYALINFAAFTRIVDGVGGLVVDARRPLRDEAYPTESYGVERLDIPAGPQLMLGDVALKYARSRHDSNDFSRAARQQTVIAALRTRLAQPEAFRGLPALIGSVGTTIETDFDPANVLPLARTATGIDGSRIESAVLVPCGAGLNPCQLTERTDGGYFLIPDDAKVRALVARLFYDPRIRREAARVDVENAGAPPGAAREVADLLAQRAYGVGEVGDAEPAPSAVVLRNPAKRYTADQLKELLGIPVETSTGTGLPDVVVRLGSDYRGPATAK